MVNNQTKQNEKSSNTENIKQLVAVFTGNQVSNSITEIRKAKQVLNSVVKNVQETMRSKADILKKQTKNIAEEKAEQRPTTEVKIETAELTPLKPVNQVSNVEKMQSDTPQKKDSFTPNRTSFNSENRTFSNAQKPYNRDYDRQSRDSQFNNRTGERRSFENRPQPAGQYQKTGGFFPRNPQGSGYTPRNQQSGGYVPRNPQGSGFAPRNQQGSGFAPRNPNTQRPYPPRTGGNFARTGTNKPTFSTDSMGIDILAKERNDRIFGNKKKTHETPTEKKSLNKKAQLRFNLSDDENEERIGRRYKNRRKEEEKVIPQIAIIDHAVITTENLTVKGLSEKIGKPVAEIVKKLFILGIMATINSSIDFETAELVASELGISIEKKVQETYEQQLQTQLNKSVEEDEQFLVKRPPVVTVMGHVDHGKTSLLDAIRKTNVISGEAGGITQHIGAYTVKLKGEKITFIDTPGHAAFTAMRARGAQLTDIAVLVVAADDGIMPQTIEAINHIKAAKVPVVVAINKMDKADANPERIMQQLADNDLLSEEWGGDIICVKISAKQGTNIDKLLEMILLVAEVKDLKANPQRSAVGAIIEAKLDKGQGPVATVLVQNGTLNIGDTIVSGTAFGRIRAMLDEFGNNVKKAGPSTPIAVLGLDAVPDAGDKVTVVDEKTSKMIIAERKNKIKEEKVRNSSAVTMDDFMNKIKVGALKNFNIIIKADVQGSAEALEQSLSHVKNEEVQVACVHVGVGAVSERDVLLAQASNAIIIAFNIKTETKAKALSESLKTEIRQYKVIYECVEDLEKVIKGMLTPKYQEKVIGHVEVRKIFKISNIGTIAGCYVTDGKIQRNAKARVLRQGEVIATSSIESLRMQKDEIKEANKTFECGIKLSGFNDFLELDIIEAFVDERIN